VVGSLQVGDTVLFDATAGGMELEDWEMEPGDGFGKFIAECDGLLGEIMEFDEDDPDHALVHLQDGAELWSISIEHLIPFPGVKVLSPRIAA
jgi:hypothetical protein